MQKTKCNPLTLAGMYQKGILQQREYPRNHPGGERKAKQDSPKKERGNSLFLGIVGEWGFRKREQEKGMHNLVVWQGCITLH